VVLGYRCTVCRGIYPIISDLPFNERDTFGEGVTLPSHSGPSLHELSTSITVVFQYMHSVLVSQCNFAQHAAGRPNGEGSVAAR